MIDKIKASIYEKASPIIGKALDTIQSVKKPLVGIGAEALKTAIPATKLLPQETRRKIVSTAGDFGVSIAQEIGKSFIAVGAEIESTIRDPLGRPQIGRATFTPKQDWEKTLFGTEKPISIQNIGEDVLAIGGEDFVKKWGSAAVPVGFLIAGLDVVPVGFGKREVLEKSARIISKTQKSNIIKDAIKPLFPEASNAVRDGLAQALRNVNDEKDVIRILQQVGSMNTLEVAKATTKSGKTKRVKLLKPEADSQLHDLANFMQDYSISKSSEIAKLEKELQRVRGARLSGSIDPKTANALAENIKDAIIETGVKQGIALRITKSGNVQLSKRAAGNFVSADFASYPYFKDVSPGVFGGTLDITRYIQLGDGSLTVSQKAKMAGQAGPLERDVLWRTRDIVKLRSSWLGSKRDELIGMAGKISDKQAVIANEVLVKINQLDAKKTAKELLKEDKISSITNDEAVVEFARQSRQYFDKLIDYQNYFRKMRGQKLIERRKYYSPEQIKDMSLWSEAHATFKNPDYVSGKILPDYIKPNKPFIGHDLARQAGIPEYLKEMNLKTILEKYTNAAAKDIFNTSIIQNNKAHIQQLDSMGLTNLARGIESWTAEVFAGVKPQMIQQVSPTIRRFLAAHRKALNIGVFPGNVSWSLAVQTASSVFTVAKYGVRNSTMAMFDWFNPTNQKWVADNAYSYIIKTSKSGKISKQDISNAMANSVSIDKSKLETVTDMANFFTESVERNLTGWSVLAAKREGAKRGLKGKALIEYASDGGAKTQSMYNMEDLPGILRNELFKTAVPFQTFNFEALNNLRELMGKAGVPVETQTERIKQVLRFYAAMTAANHMSSSINGREPWQIPESFIPYGNILFSPIKTRLTGDFAMSTSTRQLPSPIGISAEFATGVERFLVTGDMKKLRQVTIKYMPGYLGIPAGTQISRMVDAWEAISMGGVYDSAGRMLFPIYTPKEKVISMLSGVWATEGGKEYLKEREKSIFDLFEKEEEPEKTKQKFRGKITPPPRGSY